MYDSSLSRVLVIVTIDSTFSGVVTSVVLINSIVSVKDVLKVLH